MDCNKLPLIVKKYLRELRIYVGYVMDSYNKHLSGN